MKASQTRIGVGGFRSLMILGLALVAMLALGCQANKSDSNPTSLDLTSPEETTGGFARPAPPSFDELTIHVQLSADQVQPMKDALEGWRQAALTQAEEQRVNREQGIHPGPRPGVALADHEPPIFAFLEESSRILKPDQFVQLAAYLAERQKEHRQANVQGHPGHGKGIEGRPPDGRPFEGRIIDVLTDKLNLTEQQQEQVREAHATIREEIEALHDQNGGRGRDNPELRRKVKELRDSIQDCLKAILTPEQYAQLQTMQEERRTSMAERRDERAGQRIDSLSEFLGSVLTLNQPQKQQVHEILSKTENQLVNLRESMRDSSVVAGDLRQEFEKIRTEADAAIRALLSPDQAKMYDALKALLPRGGGPGPGMESGPH